MELKCIYGFRKTPDFSGIDIELVDRQNRLRIYRPETKELFWVDQYGRLRTGYPPVGNKNK